MLQVTLYTSLKLHGRTTDFPWSDFDRQVICFTRHTLQLNVFKHFKLLLTTSSKMHISIFTF